MQLCMHMQCIHAYTECEGQVTLNAREVAIGYSREQETITMEASAQFSSAQFLAHAVAR